ncbi:MAG TPA: hypothetical protein EYQ24_05175 [Bacteroidetes bacterium]|nr:hypothetical protein [Bacteroidota bacterium]
MELLTQYEIPYLHPLAVHFPLVLLLLAAAVGGIYLVRGTALWRRAALVFLLLGAASAYWASETGETLEDDVRGEPMVEAIMETHEQAAEWTLWSALAAALLFGGAAVWLRRLPAPTAVGERDPVLIRAVLAVAALVPAALVAYTAHLGGLMVWGVPVT